MKRLSFVVPIVLVTLVGAVGLSCAGNEVSALQSSAKATNEAVSTLQETINDRVVVKAKMYYLTENTFDGGDAIMACDLGFHMASMSEIQDPSNLQYANRSTAAYALLVDGQKLGAPSNRTGWVRSGVSPPSSAYDCGDWRGRYDTELGNTLALYDFWYASEHDQPISGLNTWWQAARKPCSQREHVWCVESPEDAE